jgi:hypothetical protein
LDSLQASDREVLRLEQTADLAVSSFGEFEPDDTLRIVGADEPRGGGLEPFPFIVNAFQESIENRWLHTALDRSQIDLADTIPRVSQPQAELTVIGQEKQTFGVVIEPADGIKVRPLLGKKIKDTGARLRVLSGTDATARFVDRHIEQLLLSDGTSVDSDAIGVGIDFGPEEADGLTVDGDAAAEDHLFARTAGGDAGAGEEFLEADLHRRKKKNAEREVPARREPDLRVRTPRERTKPRSGLGLGLAKAGDAVAVLPLGAFLQEGDSFEPFENVALHADGAQGPQAGML